MHTPRHTNATDTELLGLTMQAKFHVRKCLHSSTYNSSGSGHTQAIQQPVWWYSNIETPRKLLRGHHRAALCLEVGAPMYP
jgi:hypothetical protein